MRTIRILCVAVWVIIVVVTGCDDSDDCITCSNQSAVMTMFVAVSNHNLNGYGTIHSLNGLRANFDSVRVDGYLADVETSSNQPFMNSYVTYYDTTNLVAGDTVLVEAFHPGGRCWAWAKLMDYDVKPTCLSHSSTFPWDTVPMGEPIDLVWQSVPHADWYWVYMDYYYDSSGVYTRWRELFITEDTTHTVSGSALPFDGQLNVETTAMTGPRPTDPDGNMHGGYIDGLVNSYSYEYLYIYTGEGPSAGSPGERVSFEERMGLLLP